MSTNNPFAKHTNAMFASRGCDIDAAMDYAGELLNGITEGSDKVAAMTALLVLVNTAANAWTQAQGPSPAQEVAAAWVRELIAQEIDKHAQGLQDKVGDLVGEWLDENLDGKADEWARNSISFDDLVDDRVERWINNNLDLDDQVRETINDLDLVVRVR